ncbi:hypothetical protein RI129_012789 [Pyrocoelia pectoralis]|uniref:Peptidase S1 domain-containing protein n=1 Tax=Pyrocoelia pectoralis TaxID=417401 RepID=A0AAN7V7Y0_9COLE
MFRLLLVQVLIALALGAELQKRIKVESKSIFSLVEYTNFHKYPHHASLQYDGVYVCGASIISDIAVLTAAQCTLTHTILSVRYATSFYNAGGELLKVSRIFQHPQYNPNTYDNDISVLTLSSRMSRLTIAKPIRLVNTKAVEENREGHVTGWGHKEALHILTARKAKEIDRARCHDYYVRANKTLTESMVCFSDPAQNPCQGDEGSALVVDGQQVGILSWGYSCDKYYWPVVYTDVLYHRAFIKQYAYV